MVHTAAEAKSKKTWLKVFLISKVTNYEPPQSSLLYGGRQGLKLPIMSHQMSTAYNLHDCMVEDELKVTNYEPSSVHCI